MLKRVESFPSFRATACNCLINNKIYNQAGLEDLSLSVQDPNVCASRFRSDSTGSGVGAAKRQVSGKGSPGNHWFVMRDLKRPNAKLPAYKLLEKERIELFTPMKMCLSVRQGKKICEEVPFIHDLLFVHSTCERLDPIVESIPTLQYRYIRGGRYCEPMTVPDVDMERFIYAVRNSDSFRYYRPGELSPTMFGRKVRIIGGLLDRYEGRLLKGGSHKYLLVELPGFLSAGVEVNPEYIQFI